MNLAEWIFGVGGLDAAVDLRGGLAEYAQGSRNLMPDGEKMSRPWRGLGVPEGGSGSITGPRLLKQVTNTWGGLDDDGATPPAGSLFSSVADMLVYIGQGQVFLEDQPIPGVIASNILRFLLKWNGSYTDPQFGPYEAGLPEPVKPDVGIIENSIFGAANLTGTVSVKYARFRKTTGGRSRASATSEVLVVTQKAIYAVVPDIVTGQTHHIFFGTDTKLGGIGLHFRIVLANPFTQTEYTEEDVERDVAITSVAVDVLTAAAGTFTAGDIGKLVENVSGFTIAAGTTVAEVISGTQIRLSTTPTGTSGTVTLVAYAGLVRRSVVLNWLPSDLTEETAWTLDFPPPTGSHAFQLENRMFVCGYADATGRKEETPSNPDSSSSSTAPGTALIPSLPNYFESYDPRYPIYLPESVIDILSDGMESYKFIGGRNGIYAAQYLNVTDDAPLTLTVLLRGEGIAHPGNWCARERAIYLYSGKGQPVRIIEGGQVDKTFAAKVRYLMREVDQADMHVSGHPSGGGVVYAWGKTALFFDEVTNRWSTPLDLTGFVIAPSFYDQSNEVVSMVATQSRLFMVVEDDSNNRTVWVVDEDGESFAIEYVLGMSHFQDEPAPRKPKIVQRLNAAVVSDVANTTMYAALHINTLPTHITDGVTASGTNVLTSASSLFSAELLGSWVLVGGVLARIIDVNSVTSVDLGTPTPDLADSVPLNFGTATERYVLIAHRIFLFTANRAGTVELELDEMYMPGIFSYAASLYIPTFKLKNAQPLNVTIDGTVVEETGWRPPSATFTG